jgi:carboxymethylenebutenolidase
MRHSRLRVIAALAAGIAMIVASASTGTSAPAQQGGRGSGATAARQGGPPVGRGGGLANKAPDLLASVWTASSTVARTTLRHEWVDVPMGFARLHTWIEYPAGEARAPVVLVLQDEPGLDDWTRGAADQLALEGFVSVAPDLFSGFGPGGGNFDAFRTQDEAMRVAGPRLTPDEALRRAVATAAFAQRLPRANGAFGIIGFGMGGTLAFRAAAEAPTTEAVVIFYGTAPEEAVLRRVNAPAIGFYAEDDEAVTSTVAATVATMQRLGKRFAIFRYPGATHSFLKYQFEGVNTPATQDGWSRAMAFLKEQLRAS